MKFCDALNSHIILWENSWCTSRFLVYVTTYVLPVFTESNFTYTIYLSIRYLYDFRIQIALVQERSTRLVSHKIKTKTTNTCTEHLEIKPKKIFCAGNNHGIELTLSVWILHSLIMFCGLDGTLDKIKYTRRIVNLYCVIQMHCYKKSDKTGNQLSLHFKFIRMNWLFSIFNTILSFVIFYNLKAISSYRLKNK